MSVSWVCCLSLLLDGSWQPPKALGVPSRKVSFLGFLDVFGLFGEEGCSFFLQLVACVQVTGWRTSVNLFKRCRQSFMECVMSLGF